MNGSSNAFPRRHFLKGAGLDRRLLARERASFPMTPGEGDGAPMVHLRIRSSIWIRIRRGRPREASSPAAASWGPAASTG